MTATGKVVAYEQLARLPDTNHAQWLSRLSREQRIKLTNESVRHAVSFGVAANRIVSINSFPDMLRLTAEMVDGSRGIVLEVNEQTPLMHALSLREDHPDIWLAIDDAELRPDFDLLGSKAGHDRRLVLKTSHHAINKIMDRQDPLGIEISKFPFVVIEGAKPHMIEELWKRGYPLAQGRSLDGVIRLESGLMLHISGECPDCTIDLEMTPIMA